MLPIRNCFPNNSISIYWAFKLLVISDNFENKTHIHRYVTFLKNNSRRLLFFLLFFLAGKSFGQVCPKGPAGAELITNGSFQLGNDGSFTSGYTYGSSSLSPGQWGITTNPTILNSAYGSVQDHTTGSGNMMVVDADGTVGKAAYQTTVNVVPNTTYFFSAWFVNINKTYKNTPKLKFSINGVLVGSLIVVDSTTRNWQQFYTSWYSGTVTGVITIKIENMVTTSTGNDLALDDISFSTSCTKIGNLNAYGKSSNLIDTLKICYQSLPYILNPGLMASHYTFGWKTNAATTISTASSFSLSSIPSYSKLYICYDSIGDGLTCPKIDSIVIDNNLYVNIGPDQLVCEPIQEVFNTQLTLAGVKFSWTKNGIPLVDQLSTYTASMVGTYQVTASIAGCNPGSSSASLTEVSPALSGTGYYCNTGSPLKSYFIVNGGNRINNKLNIKWYNVPTGGTPLTSQLLNDSTILTSTSVDASTGDCANGLYAEDQNAFQTKVNVNIDTSNAATTESKQSGTSVSTMITVKSSSITLNSVDFYQDNNSSSTSLAPYYVNIYTNGVGTKSCNVGNNATGNLLLATDTVYFPKVPDPTLRTIALNITLPGSAAGTIYWIQIVGDVSYFTTPITYPIANSPGASVLSVGGVLFKNCPVNVGGTINSISATSGKVSSCGRTFICASSINCVLPINFLNFDISIRDNSWLLQWRKVETGSSIVKYQIVQYSYDGENFLGLDTVNSRQDSYMLPQLPNNTENKGSLYVRIVCVDNNGQATYSNIQLIEANLLQNATIKIYPNPSNASFNIESTLASLYELFTIDGKKVENGVLLSQTTIGNDLPTGVYFLRVFTGSVSNHFKLVKY